MFGYVRPLKEELKIREYEDYNAVYCALCREIGKRYGVSAKNALSYDLVFFALLLDCVNGNSNADFTCPLHPLKKRRIRMSSYGLSRAAAVNVLLAWHNFDDNSRDERGTKRIAAIFGKILFSRAYKKASADMPQYSQTIKENLDNLYMLEQKREKSIDKTADLFASILSEAAPGDDKNGRINRQILYHIGRWIYIIDACDDLQKDLKSGAYNAVAERYGITDGRLSTDIREQLEFTLNNSLAAIASAYELLEVKSDDALLRNIIYIGMPGITRYILNGGGAGVRKEKSK